MLQLCPAQKQASDTLLQLLPTHPVLEILGNPGVGKSVLLQELHQRLGGEFLQMYDFLDQTRHYHPLALEEAFEEMAMKELQAHNVVIIDDLHLLMQACHGSYPRDGLLAMPLRKLCAYATQAQKTLIVAMYPNCFRLTHYYHRTGVIPIKDFQAADYDVLCHQYLDSTIADKLNYDKIYRFASNLTASQLRRSCLDLIDHESLDTEDFIDYLKSKQLSSNVDLGEVQPADLSTLKGIDDVLRSLEANLIVPLENDELARELDLKPKRGVLLAGPPGTGKTTIGRALAHRLKSKFFLIDGTFISGTGDFYEKINYVFAAAKQNAPAIVFIDDTDVIFEDGSDTGLYRYLLTLLDGLESETAGRVCVMMTAMNISNLPPALVRSGRIELWLEMRLPDAEARTTILQTYLKTLPRSLSEAEIPQLVDATEGFTGADLKRLIEEGKTLYAYDLTQGHPLKTATEYYLAAIAIVVSNKERYAEAEAQARQQQWLQLQSHPTQHSRLLEQLQFSFMQDMHNHRFEFAPEG